MLVVKIVVHRVQPEPVDPAIQPESHRLQQPVLHVGIVKVEIRLAGQEVVQVVLPAPRIPFPGRSAEHRDPVVRGCPVGTGIGPDIPVGLRVGPVGAAFCKERVGRGRMADHLVDDDLQPKIMRLCQHRVEIRQGAEQGVNIGVIGHVIAHVGHGRGEDRRKPDRIAAQLRDMLKTPCQAGKIADAVAIAVLKRARIDLIGHRPAPPLFHTAPAALCPFGHQN